MKKILLLSMLTLLGIMAYAQTDSTDTTQVYPHAEVILNDGTILRGAMISKDNKEIVLQTDIAGRVQIPMEKIQSIKLLNTTKPGSMDVYSNLASRYFFSPSGINMKKGDGYYQNVWFSFNSFNYAFTNHITVGAGFETFSLLSGQPIFFVTPKVNYDITNKMHVGVGFLHFNVSLINPEAGSLNLLSGNFTLGDADANMTVNYGRDFDADGTIITISGFVRTGTKFGLMTENWFFRSPENYALCSFGGRVIGRKNLFDFGIITNSDIMDAGLLGIPFLSYTLRF